VADTGPGSVLATGGHSKSAVALARCGQAILGPHVGDLDTAGAQEAFGHTIDALCRLYAAKPARVACDAHPDYASTRWACAKGASVVRVQHHYAHALSCLADNGLRPPALAVTWDGSGYGEDGTLWGGELLRLRNDGFERFACLRPFSLPGGERAVREPRRSALGLLHELGDARVDLPPTLESAFSAGERRVLEAMLARRVQSPRTTSAGRLFDGVAALVGLLPVAQYEGHAAAALERALAGQRGDEDYPFALAEGAPLVIDWQPLLRAIVADVRRGAVVGRIALRFHNTLVEMLVAAAARAGERVVLLTGGCFQNLYLLERGIARLRAEGFEPAWHHAVPPNDGGLAVGQLLAASQRVEA
jgi:hydrogenase maturation protein HypF